MEQSQLKQFSADSRIINHTRIELELVKLPIIVEVAESGSVHSGVRNQPRHDSQLLLLHLLQFLQSNAQQVLTSGSREDSTPDSTSCGTLRLWLAS